MNKILYILAAIFLTLSACRKDVNEMTVDTDVPDPVVYIQTELIGKIVDEAENPIPFANVQVEDEIVNADAEGRFVFTQVEVKKSGTIIQANAAGYFEGITYSNFKADGSSFVEIRMLSKGTPTTMNAANGGDISLPSGMKVAIPANSMVSADNSLYAGTANVYTKWLDPTDENVAGVMPGELTATDEDGNPLALATFGMMVLDLEAADGAPLELANGARADIEMPIPPELESDAPDEIPLWYFDLEEEQWVQYGACIKEGNVYKGEINASGFWNCDVPIPSICLSGNIYNNDSTASAYLKVIVEDLTNNFIYWGYTDINGFFCGSVPMAVPLSITIKDLCDNIVYTAEIGPYSGDALLDDIFLDVFVETYMINISGTVAHCWEDDVPSGYVSVRYPGKLSIYSYVGGSFDINLAMNCVEFPELEIRVFSATQQEQISEEIIHNQIADLDLGELILCEPLQDYFHINVDGEDHWAMPTKWYLEDNVASNHYILEGLSGGGKFTLDMIDYQGVGTYSESVIFTSENNIDWPTYPVLNSVSPDITLEITSDDGEYIEGTFEGTTSDPTGIPLPITADFRIRKEP